MIQKFKMPSQPLSVICKHHRPRPGGVFSNVGLCQVLTLLNGYTTLRRTTLHLLNHFVEKAFCRIVILSNFHFVETVFRRILSTNILCSPGPLLYLPIIWIVRLRTLAKVTNLKLTAVSMRVLVGETRE